MPRVLCMWINLIYPLHTMLIINPLPLLPSINAFSEGEKWRERDIRPKNNVKPSLAAARSGKFDRAIVSLSGFIFSSSLHRGTPSEALAYMIRTE